MVGQVCPVPFQAWPNPRCHAADEYLLHWRLSIHRGMPYPDRVNKTHDAQVIQYLRSVSYRVAIGPQQGRQAFMIRTIRPLDRPDPGQERVAKANGFSLHAGVSCEGHQRGKRERLCRYIARPAVATPRLSLSSTGKVAYTLKTPYRDGTTQVAFDPVDFIARLAALVPKPRVNLTRYHGVLAPNHRWRGLVTPAKRGRGVKSISNA